MIRRRSLFDNEGICEVLGLAIFCLLLIMFMWTISDKGIQQNELESFLEEEGAESVCKQLWWEEEIETGGYSARFECWWEDCNCWAIHPHTTIFDSYDDMNNAFDDWKIRCEDKDGRWVRKNKQPEIAIIRRNFTTGFYKYEYYSNREVLICNDEPKTHQYAFELEQIKEMLE